MLIHKTENKTHYILDMHEIYAETQCENSYEKPFVMYS